jgi:sugar lactone lactonase YvrE
MRPFLVVLVLLVVVSSLSAQVLTVGTLAGTTDGGGYVDARGSAARFSIPTGVAVDAAGNVFVADSANHVIRKITPAGDVSTFAGTPNVFGRADGKPGSFRFPWALTVNKATSEVYVADFSNVEIRKITPDGIVSTLAGDGIAGSTDGTGSAARFSGPRGIVVDAGGMIYVLDGFRVRKITPDGVVTTLASFNSFPQGIAIDPASGTIYVAATAESAILEVAADGKVTTLAGTYGSDNADGTGTAAHFIAPRGVAVDPNGNIVVTDYAAKLLRQVTPAGVVTTLAGAYEASGTVEGKGTNARFSDPSGVAFGAAGTLYITDDVDDVILRMTPSGDITTFAGSAPKFGVADGTGTAARFSLPGAIAADADGNTYVLDHTNVLKRITPAGVVTSIAGLANASGAQDGTGSAARFNYPLGIAVDRRDGSVIVADTMNDTIRRVTSQGIVTTVAGKAGIAGGSNGTGTAATFSGPRGVAVDGSGNVYVADSNNSVIRKITPDGVVSTFAANPGHSPTIQFPTAVAVDTAGNVYVNDNRNLIRKVTPDGTINNFVGNSGLTNADGVGTAAGFNYPGSIALDRDGNLWVADVANQLIRRVTPAGVVTTVAGAVFRNGNVNGFGISARFNYPSGIAVAPNGRILIADTYNDAIRIGTVILSGRPRPTRP